MTSAAKTTVAAPPRPGYDWPPRHLAALLTANFALSLGPWLVRLADTGPVAAGFWRLGLASLIIGLALLTQPAISATVGWLAFGEQLTALDVVRMVLLAAALVMAKTGDNKNGDKE